MVQLLVLSIYSTSSDVKEFEHSYQLAHDQNEPITSLWKGCVDSYMEWQF